MRTFLTARWINLALFQFPVPAEVLAPHLPAGLELDTTDPSQGWISLVAFDFDSIRLLGLAIPLHTRFPEINLRFYVRRGEQRGVVFVKELVPRPAVAFVARWAYNAPYFTAPMRSRATRQGDRVQFSHQLRYQGRKHSIQATGANTLFTPGPDSLEHHFKEHSWGFGKTSEGQTLVYRVDHPIWRVYPVVGHHLDLDWGLLYGSKWSFLNAREPDSVVMAEGSAISVYPCGRLHQ
ncbi:DUF2071 domain-containing protein [bacterium CPR1]|nr:DUF2071 domain-containing protein [bacterium CPR1]